MQHGLCGKEQASAPVFSAVLLGVLGETGAQISAFPTCKMVIMTLTFFVKSFKN